MKCWEVKDGVLRITENEHWCDVAGRVMVALLFGGVFGGVGCALFVCTVAGIFGFGPMVPGSFGAAGWLVPMIFSLPFIGVGGWFVYETIVPWRTVEISCTDARWTVVTTRSPLLFPRYRFSKTNHPEGAPDWAEIRRGSKTTWYEYRVLIGGAKVVDFKYRLTAEAVCDALRDLDKNTGPWTER